MIAFNFRKHTRRYRAQRATGAGGGLAVYENHLGLGTGN